MAVEGCGIAKLKYEVFVLDNRVRRHLRTIQRIQGSGTIGNTKENGARKRKLFAYKSVRHGQCVSP